MLNAYQKSAVNQLRKALDNAHREGLKGGVFDCNFVVWPAKTTPDPRESSQFFEFLSDIGGVIKSPMQLDGGAGV